MKEKNKAEEREPAYNQGCQKERKEEMHNR